MPAIDRGLDSLSFLPDAVRDALRRRLRELGGLALIGARAPAGARARDLVGAGPVAEPRHQCAGAQRARRARRHRRRPADADVRRGGARARSADRDLGLAARHPPAAQPRAHPAAVLDPRPCCLPPAFAACLPRSAAWPLPAGLGGVIGDWMLRLPALLAGGTLAGLPRARGRRRGRHRSAGLLCDRCRFRMARPMPTKPRKTKPVDRRDEERALDLARLDRARLPQPQGAARRAC